MRFAVKLVAARLGDRTDYAAQGAAVLGLDSGRLHLYFLEEFIHGILTGIAVDHACDGKPIDREVVLSGTGAVDLDATLNLPRVDRRGSHRHVLETTGFRHSIKFFFSHVV